MKMKWKYEYFGRKVIKQAAAQQGVSVKEYRNEISKAIDEAWAHPSTEQLLLQRKLFPYGKPSPEEFLIVMAKEIKNERSPEKMR